MGRTTANEDQLRQGMKTLVDQANMQTIVIKDLSSQLGKAGKLIEDITRATHSPKRTDESARKEIKKLLSKFNSDGARGRGESTRS